MSVNHTNVVERLDIAECDDLFQIHLHRQRYDFVLKRVTAEDRVLEIGTGLGAFSSELAPVVGDYRGIEFDAESCHAAKLRVDDPESIKQGDAMALEFRDGEFDKIICLEVLEHLTDYRKALNEIIRVLRPGGMLLASIPHVETGAPSKTNPHHLYEPGENEFRCEISARFAKANYHYQRYPETRFETFLRIFRMRRFFGKAEQYRRLTEGHEIELRKIAYDQIKSGLLLGLTVEAFKEAVHE